MKPTFISVCQNLVFFCCKDEVKAAALPFVLKKSEDMKKEYIAGLRDCASCGESGLPKFKAFNPCR